MSLGDSSQLGESRSRILSSRTGLIMAFALSMSRRILPRSVTRYCVTGRIHSGESWSLAPAMKTWMAKLMLVSIHCSWRLISGPTKALPLSRAMARSAKGCHFTGVQSSQAGNSVATMYSSSSLSWGASLTRFWVRRVRRSSVISSPLWPGENLVYLLCRA